MIGKIYITGEIGVETTLLDVIKQAKNQKDATEFVVKVDSNGGYVEDGMDIYHYLRNLKKPITTITTRAYSIASVIFMAGDIRIIPEGSNDAVMIHLPWMQATGDSFQLEDYLNGLKAVESDLVKFYSKNLEIDSDTIHSLLRNETYLSATQALEIGIATQLQKPQLAVAKLQNNENNKEEKEETLMNKLNKKIDQIMNLLSGKIKAELILQDATGVEIVFPELNEGDTPEVEDKATVDGSDAEGEFLMPDGSIMVFEKGGLKEVKPAEEMPAENAEGDAPAEEQPTEDEKDAKIAELEAKIAELESQLAESAKAEEVEKMADVIAEMAKKFNALAKQVGSDFSTETKGETPTIKAKEEDNKSFKITRK